MVQPLPDLGEDDGRQISSLVPSSIADAVAEEYAPNQIAVFLQESGHLLGPVRQGQVGVAGQPAHAPAVRGQGHLARQLTDELTAEITMLNDVIAGLLAGDRGYQVIQQLTPRQPRIRHQGHSRPGHQAGLADAALGSDRGRPAVRSGHGPGAVKAAIIARRGKETRNIAKVAAARKLLTLVYYGLRDGQIRALSAPATPRGPGGMTAIPRPAARRAADRSSAPPALLGRRGR